MEFGRIPGGRLTKTLLAGGLVVTLATACGASKESGGNSAQPHVDASGKPVHPATCFEALKYGGDHTKLSAYGAALQAAVDAGMPKGTFDGSAFDMRWVACTGANISGVEEIMSRMADGDPHDQRRTTNTVTCAILLANLGVIKGEGVLSDAQLRTIQDGYDGGQGKPRCGGILENARSGGFQNHDAQLVIPLPKAGQDTFTTDQTEFATAAPAAYEGGGQTVLAEGYVPVPAWARQFRAEQPLGMLAAAAV
ncbi:MAG TPA: hypothetical protein VF466_03330 [Candidatus Saccharimonadales bacterium]